jgi:hypothetical protein
MVITPLKGVKGLPKKLTKVHKNLGYAKYYCLFDIIFVKIELRCRHFGD